MNSPAHDKARKLIQEGRWAEPDRLFLQQHLALCEECRLFATMHVQLQQQLPRLNVRQHPTQAQREAIYSIGAKHQTPRFWRPLMAAGSFAAIIFLVTAFWFVLSVTRPMVTQPTAPATLPATSPVTTPLATFSPQATTDPSGTYMSIKVPAPSLSGNLIGVPLEQEVVVYLPPSYESSDRHYPVVYGLLTTTSLNVKRANDNTTFQIGNTVQTAMKIALRNSTQEMIVVVPDPVNSLGLANYYVNSPVTGNWEDFVARDLVTYIDAHYRTLPSAQSRAIFGEYQHSLGALLLASRHPDVFSSVSMIHPVLFFPGYSIVDNLLQSRLGRTLMLDLLTTARAHPTEADLKWLADRFPEDEYLPYALSTVMAYGMAFVPDISAGAPYIEYPYTDIDGEPDADILQRWENGLGNIPAKLQPYQETLRGLAITIDYYDNVASFDPRGSLYLSEELTNLNVPHSLRASQLYQPSTMGILGKYIFPALSAIFASE